MWVKMVWGCTDSNREPSDYEPPALTVELHPRSVGKDEGKNEKLEVKYNAPNRALAAFIIFRDSPNNPCLP